MKKVLFALIVFIMPYSIYGQSIAIKGNVGTMGGGIEGVVGLHEKVNARIGGNLFSYSYLYETGSDDEFDLDASLELESISALLDWHPFGSAIRITSGVIYNNSAVNVGLLPKQSYSVGGDTYSPEELGNLDAQLSFNRFAPYVALGFGNTFTGSRFGMNTDIGMIYTGSPNVAMSADGLLEPSAEQAPILQENLSWAQMSPVVTVSLYYRIF